MTVAGRDSPVTTQAKALTWQKKDAGLLARRLGINRRLSKTHKVPLSVYIVQGQVLTERHEPWHV